MSLTAAEIASSVESLISLPAAGIQAARALNNETTSNEEVAKIIEGDPSLTAVLLRMANSSAINRGREVDNVTKAVNVLGREQVRNLAFGASVSKAFKGVPTKLVSVNDFWEHSLFCATAARLVARKAKCAEADAAFTAGLLHDIGHLVMFAYQPEYATAALEASHEAYDGILNYEIEKELLGFDHTDVGEALAKKWELPNSIIECIGHHHAPLEAGTPSDMLMCVHIANSVAILAKQNSEDLGEAPPIVPEAWEQLGLKWFDIIDLTESCVEESKDLVSIFQS